MTAWISPEGFRLGVAQMSLDDGSVPCVAVLDLQGYPLPRAAVARAASLADGEDDDIEVSAMQLAASLSHRGVSWPTTFDDEVDHRRDRRLVTAVGRVTFEHEIRDDDDPEHSTPHSMATAFQPVHHLNSDERWDIAWQARWGIHPRAYGETTVESVERVSDRLRTIGNRIKKGENADRLFGAELSDCPMEDAASWLHLVRLGSVGNHAGVRLLSKAALESLRTATDAPSPLKEVVEREEGIHDLLYGRHPELAYDTFAWVPAKRGAETAGLRLPHTVAMARALLGSDWWEDLIRAFRSGDDGPKEDTWRLYFGLLNGIAGWRAAGRSVPRSEDEEEALDGNYESPSDDTLKGLIDGELREVLTEALSTLDPTDREIVVRTELEDESGVEVAQDLGISESGVSQRRTRAKRTLSRDARLGALYEDKAGDDP